MINRVVKVSKSMTEKEAWRKLFCIFTLLAVTLILFIVGGCWLGAHFGHPAIGSLLGVFCGITSAVAGIYLILVSGHKEKK